MGWGWVLRRFGFVDFNRILKDIMIVRVLVRSRAIINIVDFNRILKDTDTTCVRTRLITALVDFNRILKDDCIVGG